MSMAYECHSKKIYISKIIIIIKTGFQAKCAIDQNALQVNANSRGSP